MGIHGRRLIMARPELAAKLEASRAAPQAAQLRSSHDTMVGLMMAPVKGGRDELGPGSRPERAIYMHEVGRPAPIPETLIAELFGLSLPEARLATLLCTGLTLREAAAEMHIAENSARTYSKIAFSKLGVSRQAELVRLILTSVAIFGNIRSS
jgi:DNA-binding CsgD family transcriptional regulator